MTSRIGTTKTAVPVTKAIIIVHHEGMLQSGQSRSSLNQALSAIRKLVAGNSLVPPTLAYRVERVNGV
ncbi:MAG: hypothetical protein H6656_00695 [Ardenticatenaceae bacterium]|nr:hypothetical protein [Anaerolineales bacterium]MCB9005902.1 hypothetical protein [Ardenticatenaceae bacterium]